MKKFLNLFIAFLVCLILNQTMALASSHREAPLISNDPLADNTDVYAFRSPCDTNKVVLIANYIPFELPQGGPNYYNFSPTVRYEVHVKNNSATTGDDIVYRFTFRQSNQDSTTFFNIRLGRQNLLTEFEVDKSVNGGTFNRILINGRVAPNNIGPRSITNATVGLGATSYESLWMSTSVNTLTGEKIFCGPADDPFFVDLGGAFDVGGLRKPGRDGLTRYNCHSIVIEVPVAGLQKTGKNTSQATSILDSDFIIGVYATSSRQQITTFDSTSGAQSTSGNWIQVSRLGMPLTNEAIIPIGNKDKWNTTLTNSAAEGQFDKYLKNPEFALYMDNSQYGAAVPGLAALRIQSRSLANSTTEFPGYDFRNFRQGLFPLKGTPALDGTALAQAAYGNYLLPDNASPRAVDLLPIFQTGVPNLRPYQLATGKPAGNPLAAGKPFINNFLPTFGDMLRLNMAVPVTPRVVNGSPNPDFSSLGLVQAAVLGLTDSRYTASGTALQFIPNMDGFPNGRRLEDDVTTIELQAVGGVVLAAIGLWYDDYNGTGSPVTPQLLSVLGFNAGVTKNDTTLRDCFPYVQLPWAGFTGAQYVGPKSQNPLPVNFLNFTAEKSGQKVWLKWQVTNESNNDHYEVEQSLGAGIYKTIGSVRASTGALVNNYDLIDNNPSLTKVNFYRIKQIDKEGKFSYSPIRLVKFASKAILTVTPNPATDHILVYSSETGINISLFDGGGRKIASKTLNNGSVDFNISRLAKGVYMVVAESNGVRIETSKIVKQ